jgi:hypothetical protein
MFTFQALQLLLFLIPGFISATILNVLVVRRDKKELESIVEALIFSMLIYTMHSVISGQSPVTIDQTEATISYSYSYESRSLLWLILLSVLTPLGLSFLITNDWHMKLARKFRISKKTARSSVWLDVFCDIKQSVIINLENGRRIFGWPMYYSDEPEKPYIFLYKPAWIEGEEFIDLDVEGILITPEQKIESIEFLRD